MEAEAEAEGCSTPRLPLFLKPTNVQSPQRSGTLTPPLYSSAAVPFRWEEEPGKPRGCSAADVLTAIESSPKCLELPPRLYLEANVSKLASPTTVLDGPYVGQSCRFESSSFRMMRREGYGSFRGSFSLERLQLGALVLGKRGIKNTALLGSLRWVKRAFKGKRDGGGATSYVFPSSSVDRQVEGCNHPENVKNVKITSIRRSGSFSTRTRSHFWATIREGLKQVVPWNNRKPKKERFF